MADAQLFDRPDRMKLVSKGVDYIYNVQPDSADIWIEKVEQEMPDHPVVPMMRALNVLWQNIPLVTLDTVFKEFSGHLRETVRKAYKLDDGDQTHPEAIFFEMAARGLLAEYYADDDHYMKALAEASKAYDLIKKGFDLSDEIPEFLLTTGVYNYFREKYPERHPVYKPLLWFFRSGDIELGLAQIKEATRKAVLSKVEAYVYLAYIYLRYEYNPKAAQTYLFTLHKNYPNNYYISTKLLESLTAEDDFKKAPVTLMDSLRASDRPYYQMAGEAFYGLYMERIKKSDTLAIQHYRASLSAGAEILGHGEYYRGLAYLGMGRIYSQQEKKDRAIFNLEKAITETDSEEIQREANLWLKKVR